MIYLDFNLDDGFKFKTFDVWAKTGCRQWYISGKDRIVPMSYWTYIDHPLHYISFNDETTREGLFGDLLLIYQTTTVINPVQIDGENYNCTILGDGVLQHFGRGFPKQNPARISLACKSIPSDDGSSLLTEKP